MDAATRQVVADIAAKTHTTLVVDETMVNLWYDAPPPPPLAAFNRDAPIIMLGSAGKSFWEDYVLAGCGRHHGLLPHWCKPATRSI